jgi:hypothetical protein
VLIVSSVFAWTWSGVFACVIALAGLGAFGFGSFAPRDKRVAFATVVLAILQM